MSKFQIQKIVPDGRDMVMTFQDDDTEQSSYRISREEFEKQLNMMKVAALKSAPVEAKEEPRPDVLQLILESRQQLAKEMGLKLQVLNDGYAQMGELVGRVTKQRSEVLDNVQGETAKNIDTLSKLIESTNSVQENMVEQIASKEKMIESIMKDIGERNEWTWETAKKIDKEAARSLTEIVNFKRLVREKVDALVTDAQEVVEASDTERNRQKSSFDAMITNNTKEIERIQAVYQDAAKERGKLRELKAQILKEKEDESYKQMYYDSEMARRTDVARRQAVVVEERVATALAKLWDAKKESEELCGEIEERINSAFISYEAMPKEIEPEIGDMLKELEESHNAVKSTFSIIKREIDRRATTGGRVACIFDELSKMIDFAPHYLESLIKEVDGGMEKDKDLLSSIEAALDNLDAEDEIKDEESSKKTFWKFFGN